MPNLLIFGFGYTGQALARRLRGKGWDVWAAVRSPASADAARAAGVTPITRPTARRWSPPRP